MKKQELTRRIYKYKVPLKTLKYSYLYLLAIEKKDALGNIMERYVKFGKTIDTRKDIKHLKKTTLDMRLVIFGFLLIVVLGG